jgi:hypothetical protein
MFLSAYNSTARDGSAGFINKRFGPRQVILFDHSFRDALIDELIHRVINGCKLATRHAPRATRHAPRARQAMPAGQVREKLSCWTFYHRQLPTGSLVVPPRAMPYEVGDLSGNTRERQY